MNINEHTAYAMQKYLGATQKSKHLNKIYSKIAKKNKCFFIDASQLEVGTDGVHMTKESHIKLAKMLSKKIKSIKF